MQGHAKWPIAAGLLLFCAGAWAQTLPRQSPPPQTPQRYTEQMEVRLAEVDVVVTDRDGKRVYGLTADDFEIFEGRTRQTISNFSEYRRESAPAQAAAAPGSAARPPAPRVPHTMLILIDSLPRGLAQQTVFRNLEDMVGKLMHEGDRVDIVCWMPGFERPESLIGSSDVASVQRALRSLGGVAWTDPASALAQVQQLEEKFLAESSSFGQSMGFSANTAADAEFAAMIRDQATAMQVKRKTTLIKGLVDRLAGRSGKKTLLYVSANFAIPDVLAGEGRQQALYWIEQLTKAANAGGVTIYAVKPIMPEGEDFAALQSSRTQFDKSMDALRYLTEPTGGLLEFGQVSVESLTVQIADDLESYYSLAWRTKADGRDHERKISVRTKNPEYRVRTRGSLIEKSNETKAREMVVTRLFTNDGGHDLQFQVAEGTLKKQGRNRWLLPIELTIPTGQLKFVREGATDAARVKVLITAANDLASATGITENELRVEAKGDPANGHVVYATTLLFEQRGSVVSIGVYDRNSGLLGVRTVDTRGRIK